MELKTETETKILDAAKSVFVKNGFEGTRLQEIANEAGINKALLHYYFRSKEKLFEAVFRDAFSTFIPKIRELLTSGQSFEDKISQFIESYISLIIENPYLPHFILHEIYRKPDLIVGMMKNMGMEPELFFDHLILESEKDNYRKINQKHLIVNVLSMCLFPFIAKPMLTGILFENDVAAFNTFVNERKKEVKEFVLHSIKLK